MLSMNNFSIENILCQRHPMLMLDRVIDISDGQICVKPKTDGFYAGKEHVFYQWMMLESMGQAAELLWRLKGMKGTGYLAKVDEYTNFPSKLRIQDYNFYIIAEEKIMFNKLCQSSIRFFYSDSQYASAKITHYFE